MDCADERDEAVLNRFSVRSTEICISHGTTAMTVAAVVAGCLRTHKHSRSGRKQTKRCVLSVLVLFSNSTARNRASRAHADRWC